MPTRPARLIDDAVRQLGPLEILVNNAGIEKRAPFVEVTKEDYDKVLHVNLKGAFFTTQAFVRHLLADQRPGKIIHISSVHEELPFPGYASYCASKGGLQLLTRDLAVELGPHGITVNGIAPGAIITEINRSLLDSPGSSGCSGRSPWAGWARPTTSLRSPRSSPRPTPIT
jgi:glucose 1-dehydrogenase